MRSAILVGLKISHAPNAVKKWTERLSKMKISTTINGSAKLVCVDTLLNISSLSVPDLAALIEKARLNKQELLQNNAITAHALGKEIEYLALPTRLSNFMKSSGVSKVGDLKDLTINDIKVIPGIGKKSAMLIAERFTHVTGIPKN